MGNLKFQNSLHKIPQNVPPIWFMRQAGRYHKHYQTLRARHDFDQLCRQPQLACEVTMGPIEDFDFDVAILFSDLLYPLDALGLELSYGDSGPKLARRLTRDNVQTLPKAEAAISELGFQKEALQLIRKALPAEKSLIGFVGGPWTLFVYAVENGHAGNLVECKSAFDLYQRFCETLVPLLKLNIDLQLKGGAEIVMIFDTAAGELSPVHYQTYIEPHLLELTRSFGGKLGYYSKGTQSSFFTEKMKKAPWAGFGFDHRWDLPSVLRNEFPGFIQGNFDQAFLGAPPEIFNADLEKYLAHYLKLSPPERKGWVCALGHGVLPSAREENVRHFVKRVREVFK